MHEPEAEGEAADVGETVPRAVAEPELLIAGHSGGGKRGAGQIESVRCVGVVDSSRLRDVYVPAACEPTRAT